MKGLFSDEGDMAGKPSPYATPSDADVLAYPQTGEDGLLSKNAAVDVVPWGDLSALVVADLSKILLPLQLPVFT